MPDGGTETDLADAAQRLHAATLSLRGFLDVFAVGVVYARTPAEAPRLYVAELAGRGKWACVFTSTKRLAASVGECDYLGMTGGEFAELAPSGVGLVVDTEDGHAVTLPPDVLGDIAPATGTRRDH